MKHTRVHLVPRHSRARRHHRRSPRQTDTDARLMSACHTRHQPWSSRRTHLLAHIALARIAHRTHHVRVQTAALQRRHSRNRRRALIALRVHFRHTVRPAKRHLVHAISARNLIAAHRWSRPRQRDRRCRLLRRRCRAGHSRRRRYRHNLATIAQTRVTHSSNRKLVPLPAVQTTRHNRRTRSPRRSLRAAVVPIHDVPRHRRRAVLRHRSTPRQRDTRRRLQSAAKRRRSSRRRRLMQHSAHVALTASTQTAHHKLVLTTTNKTRDHTRRHVHTTTVVPNSAHRRTTQAVVPVHNVPSRLLTSTRSRRSRPRQSDAARRLH